MRFDHVLNLMAEKMQKIKKKIIITPVCDRTVFLAFHRSILHHRISCFQKQSIGTVLHKNYAYL